MRTLASLCALLTVVAAFGSVTPASAAQPAPAAKAADGSAASASRRLATGPALVLAAGTGEKLPAKAEGAAAGKAAPLIDINTATEQELATLHGIGEVRAKAIVKGRPYARKDDLVRRKIIPQSVYDDIREQIIAKQP